MRTLRTILCAACAGAGAAVYAAAPKADYAADAENIRAYREAALAIADFKLKEVDDALAKEDPIEGLGRRMSSGGDFGGFFMWDSVFQSIWASRARERDYPILSSLDNFYMLQLEDGFIVREYSSRGLPCWNPDHPIALNPPILSWGEIEVFRHGVSDRARLERVYPKLVRFHESLKRRYRRADGLYFGEQLGCGMDDIVRSPAGMSEEDKKKGGIVFSEAAFGPGLMIPSLDAFRAHWLKTRSGDSSWNRQMGWIDITSQVALDCLNLAEIAAAIGKDDETKSWRAEHAEIAKAVNDLCWDEERGYYFDRGPDGIIPRYHGGSFWTMLARIPTPERAKRMVRVFEDPEIFGTPVPFPALAKCEPDYDSENHYWRGQVWPPTAYVAIIGLRTLGFEDLAQRLGRRYYNATYELWKATGTIWENLSSQQCDHPKPHAGRDFCGWGALAPVALPDDLGWTKPSAGGENPITAEGAFLSDPAPRVGPDGTLWIFGSRDVTTNGYCSHANDSYETRDLRRWTAHRDILVSKGPQDGVPFLDWELLAPDAIYANGKWNLFYCMFHPDHAEGVASSESAAGPFTGAREFPGCTQIDPSVFRDDDGTYYYTWGQFAMNMAKLKPDLSGLVEGSVRTNVIDEARHHFHEGSQLTKRNGIYYLTFADISRRGRPTAIGYATAPSVFGPYTYRGVIIDNAGCDPESWNNHGGIVEYKGRWYVFYHRSTNGSRSMRKACVEPIAFDDRGLIREVEMTTSGVGGPLDPFVRTEARTACGLTGGVRIVTDADGRERLGEIRGDDTATWRYFDFSRPASAVELEVRPLAGGKVEISDGKGAVWGTAEVPTGDGVRRMKVSVPVRAPAGSRQTVRLSFLTAAEKDRFGSLEAFSFRP